MRAGLLSDPRVVATLTHEFVPCLSSALNTPQCFADPRDHQRLGAFVRTGSASFDGGEREAFVLPDGTMLAVFLSLDVAERGERLHRTAAGRRSPRVSAAFQEHAAAALRAAHGALPAGWQAYWDGTAPAVAAAAALAPRWPRPAHGARALRVFVRNGALMYDELNGCELVALPAADDWLEALDGPGAAAALPRALLCDLVRAMVPRGGVDTRLADASIDGDLRLDCEAIAGGLLRGRVSGRFAMQPTKRSEASTRENAGALFRASGELVGRFAFDPHRRCLTELRVAAQDATLQWLPPWSRGAGKPSWLRTAFELVEGEPPERGGADREHEP